MSKVTSHRKESANDKTPTSTLIQARAFSSYKAVMAAAEEIKNNEEFARAKKLCIPVNAPYILSLVKSNDALLQDTVRDQYIERVKQFVNSSKGKKTTEESILTDIRGNCNLTASLFLQSCRKPKTLSLLALSHKSDDDCQKREVSQNQSCSKHRRQKPSYRKL